MESHSAQRAMELIQAGRANSLPKKRREKRRNDGRFLPFKKPGNEPKGFFLEKNKTCIGAAILPIPGTQMTLVLVGKGLVLEG